MLSCVAFAEWLRTASRLWLKILAVSCVLGTYTLSFYIIFGGILLLLAFCYRPSKDTLLAALLSLAAIAMLYLPIVGELYKVFQGFALKYGREMSNFNSIEGVFRTLQYFFPDQLMQINAPHCVVLALLVLLYVAFGRLARVHDRLSAAGVSVAVGGFFTFCLFYQVVPLRVSAYLAAPLAFLGAVFDGFDTFSAFSGTLSFACPNRILSVRDRCLSEVPDFAEPLTASQNWRAIGLFIERAFPEGTRVWVGGRYGRLLQWNLSSRKMPEGGILDEGGLESGRLVAVEGFIKDDDEKKRLRWEDLPENVRFVTIPLRINYQRIFFVPPTSRGIRSISVDNRPLNLWVSGRQPYDPGLLAKSVGHRGSPRSKHAAEINPGPSSIPETRVALPMEIPLPAALIVELDPTPSAGTCNLLFSQSLKDKSVSAEVKSAGGNWLAASNVFILGEFVSIALERDDYKSVRIRFEQKPSFSNRISGIERPPFGLLDGWTTPSKTRIP